MLSDEEKKNVELYMLGFHWRDNIFWKRLEDGTVRVRQSPTGEWNLPALEWNIPPEHWASIVASVSASGETSATWQAALDFHAAAAPAAPKAVTDAMVEAAVVAFENHMNAEKQVYTICDDGGMRAALEAALAASAESEKPASGDNAERGEG